MYGRLMSPVAILRDWSRSHWHKPLRPALIAFLPGTIRGFGRQFDRMMLPGTIIRQHRMTMIIMMRRPGLPYRRWLGARTMIPVTVRPGTSHNASAAPVNINIHPLVNLYPDVKTNAGILRQQFLNVNHFRIVIRHVYHGRIGGLNADTFVLFCDDLLLGIMQIAFGISLGPLALNRRHDILRLNHIRRAQRCRPIRILRQQIEHHRVMRQHFGGVLPGLLSDEFLRRRGINCEPLRCGLNFFRIAHGRERSGQKRIGI